MASRRRHDEQGAAAVEFALIGLILITLLVSVIQFAIFFWGYQSASAAAREAARFGAVAPCDSGAIAARGNLRMNETAPASNDTATVTVDAPALAVGEPLTVEVTFTPLNFGVVPGFDGVVTRGATARIENIPAGGC